MIRNLTRGTVLAERVSWALKMRDRSRGLLDSDGLEPGDALVISPCSAVHMFGMGFAIDVVFVSKTGRVVRAIRSLRPGQLTRVYFTARHTVELPEGAIDASATEEGDQLDLGEAS